MSRPLHARRRDAVRCALSVATLAALGGAAAAQADEPVPSPTPILDPTPIASPTAASDGPEATKEASMPPKWKRSVAVPSRRTCERPARTSSQTGTAGLSASLLTMGIRPLERTRSTSWACR